MRLLIDKTLSLAETENLTIVSADTDLGGIPAIRKKKKPSFILLLVRVTSPAMPEGTRRAPNPRLRNDDLKQRAEDTGIRCFLGCSYSIVVL